MAFTRRALKEAGLSDDLIEKVMALHGVSMGDYMLKSELQSQIDAAVTAAVTDAKKGFEGLDIEGLKTQAAKATELETKLSRVEFNNTVEKRLLSENVVDATAVMALLDMSKITLKDGKLEGIDDQIASLKESKKWAFVDTSGAQQQTQAGGQRHGTPAQTKSDDKAYLDAKYGKNPFYHKE